MVCSCRHIQHSWVHVDLFPDDVIMLTLNDIIAIMQQW